jgi:hypothetical protein
MIERRGEVEKVGGKWSVERRSSRVEAHRHLAQVLGVPLEVLGDRGIAE